MADLIDYLPDLLGDFFNNILDYIIMPIWVLLSTVVNFLINTVNGLVDLVYGIYQLSTIILNMVVSTLSCMFPGILTSIFMLLFMLVVYMRIYYFIKGIKIGGTGL